MGRRDPETYSPVHVINIDIQDNHEEATLGAFQICDLCEKVRHKFYFLLDLEPEADSKSSNQLRPSGDYDILWALIIVRASLFYLMSVRDKSSFVTPNL